MVRPFHHVIDMHFILKVLHLLDYMCFFVSLHLHYGVKNYLRDVHWRLIDFIFLYDLNCYLQTSVLVFCLDYFKIVRLVEEFA